MAQQPDQQAQYTVVATTESETTDEKPPSYSGIIAQIKAITSGQNKSPAKVGQSVYEVFCNSVFFKVFLIIAAISPVADIVIGIMFKKKCPIQPSIPLYLIVFGSCSIFIAVSLLINNLMFTIKFGNAKAPSTKARCLTWTISLLSIFVLVWFLIGNYWIYSILSRVQYEENLYPSDFCHKICYTFAFWSITSAWIFIGLLCLCCCGFFGTIIAWIACVRCLKD